MNKYNILKNGEPYKHRVLKTKNLTPQETVIVLDVLKYWFEDLDDKFERKLIKPKKTKKDNTSDRIPALEEGLRFYG